MRASGSSSNAQTIQLALAEAAADAPGVAQRAVLVVDAEQQRTHAAAAGALAGQPSSDHELLAAGALDLDPVRGAPAGLVDGGEPLGDHSLEPLLGGGLEELAAVAHDVVGHLHARSRQPQVRQPLAAGAVGVAGQRVSFQPQQVEDHVDDRGGLHPPPSLGRARDLHPLLEGGEARAPVGGERHDLPVEDRATRPQRA